MFYSTKTESPENNSNKTVPENMQNVSLKNKNYENWRTVYFNKFNSDKINYQLKSLTGKISFIIIKFDKNIDLAKQIQSYIQENNKIPINLVYETDNLQEKVAITFFVR